MVNRNVLDEIGGFSYVRSSAQEDTDLGKKIRGAGFSIGLVRVNNLVADNMVEKQENLVRRN